MSLLQVDCSHEFALSAGAANPNASFERVAIESSRFAERMESLLTDIEAQQQGSDHGVRITRALLHNFLDALIDLARDARCHR